MERPAQTQAGRGWFKARRGARTCPYDVQQLVQVRFFRKRHHLYSQKARNKVCLDFHPMERGREKKNAFVNLAPEIQSLQWLHLFGLQYFSEVFFVCAF